MEPITIAGIMADVWYHLPHHNGRTRAVYACPDSDGTGLLLLTVPEFEANDGGVVDYTLTAAGEVLFQGQPTGIVAADLTTR